MYKPVLGDILPLTYLKPLVLVRKIQKALHSARNLPGYCYRSKLGDLLHCRKALQHPAGAGAADAKGLHQLAAWQQPMLSERLTNEI